MPAKPKIMLTTKLGIKGNSICNKNVRIAQQIIPRIELTIIFFRKKRIKIAIIINVIPEPKTRGLLIKLKAVLLISFAMFAASFACNKNNKSIK